MDQKLLLCFLALWVIVGASGGSTECGKLSNDTLEVTVPLDMNMTQMSEVTFNSSDNTEREISIRLGQVELPIAWDGNKAKVGEPGSNSIYQSTEPLTLKFSRNNLIYNILWENESLRQETWTNGIQDRLTIVMKPVNSPPPPSSTTYPAYPQAMFATVSGLTGALVATLVCLLLNIAALVNNSRERSGLEKKILDLEKKIKDKATKRVEEKAPISPARPNVDEPADEESYISPIDVRPFEVLLMQKENALKGNVCHMPTPETSIAPSFSSPPYNLNHTSVSRQGSSDTHYSHSGFCMANTDNPTYSNLHPPSGGEDLYLTVEEIPR